MMTTPITRHIEECSQCRGDLKTLRSLRLSSEQLMKLRRIFSAKRGEGEVSCSEAQKSISSFVRMFFTEVGREVSTHLCTCPDCRKLVYEHREELIARLMPAGMTVKDFSCRYGKRFDIFDYCFAFGAEDVERRFSRFDPEFISHGALCPRCLSRIQQLHKTILDIAERERSGVLTSNPVIMPAEREGFMDLDYIYAKWPIRVWVRSEAEAEVRAAAEAEAKLGASVETEAKDTTVTKTGRSTMKNRIIKLAAVAVMIIAALVGIRHLSVPSNGGGVAWAEVVKNVEQAQAYSYRLSKSKGFVGEEEVRESEKIVYTSSAYGVRTDTYINEQVARSTVTLPALRVMIGVIHTKKMYTHQPLSEKVFRAMSQEDTKEIVKRYISADYEELGREIIDGVEVEGIEVVDPNVLYWAAIPVESFGGSLWVDVETDLPVLVEMDIVFENGMTQNIVMDEFEWDAELDAGVFLPEIPAGYTPMKEEGKEPKAIEQE